MPYPSNYAEDISSIEKGSLERIEKSIFRFADPQAENPADRAIIEDDFGNSLIVADGGFGIDEENEFLELHFYSRDTNELQHSVTVPLEEGYLWIRDSGKLRIGVGAYPTIQFGFEMWREEDVLTWKEAKAAGKAPNELDTYVDFYQKYLSDIPAGYYNVIINFFAAELGKHNDHNWIISEISDSQRELKLIPAANNDNVAKEIEQFADNSIFATDFRELMLRLQVVGAEPNADIVQGVFDYIDHHSVETMDFIGRNTENPSDIRLQIEKLLHEIIVDVMSQMRDYNEDQIKDKKYRMTQKRFEAELLNRVDIVLAGVINNFPEPGELFINQ